jgi:hypothetical protein
MTRKKAEGLMLTALTVGEIAERLSLGSWKSLNNRLYLLGKERNANKK